MVTCNNWTLELQGTLIITSLQACLVNSVRSKLRLYYITKAKMTYTTPTHLRLIISTTKTATKTLNLLMTTCVSVRFTFSVHRNPSLPTETQNCTAHLTTLSWRNEIRVTTLEDRDMVYEATLLRINSRHHKTNYQQAWKRRCQQTTRQRHRNLLLKHVRIATGNKSSA